MCFYEVLGTAAGVNWLALYFLDNSLISFIISKRIPLIILGEKSKAQKIKVLSQVHAIKIRPTVPTFGLGPSIRQLVGIPEMLADPELVHFKIWITSPQSSAIKSFFYYFFNFLKKDLLFNWFFDALQIILLKLSFSGETLVLISALLCPSLPFLANGSTFWMAPPLGGKVGAGPCLEAHLCQGPWFFSNGGLGFFP